MKWLELLSETFKTMLWLVFTLSIMYIQKLDVITPLKSFDKHHIGKVTPHQFLQALDMARIEITSHQVCCLICVTACTHSHPTFFLYPRTLMLRLTSINTLQWSPFVQSSPVFPNILNILFVEITYICAIRDYVATMGIGNTTETLLSCKRWSDIHPLSTWFVSPSTNSWSCQHNCTSNTWCKHFFLFEIFRLCGCTTLVTVTFLCKRCNYFWWKINYSFLFFSIHDNLLK